jgi:lipid II:glycine glycyltransferase (peptidoglycan interpeptide bridge formation enzyme)
MGTELTSGYSTEVDNIDKDSWHRILEKFDDANIYQTWSYETIRSGKKKLSHLLLKKNGEVVAAAQARITKIPFTNLGVAYIRWGPLWRRRGEISDPELLAEALRALRNEYVCGRKLIVRILPLLFDDVSDLFDQVLVQEGFIRSTSEDPQRTLLVDLNHSLAELRKGLDQKWRNRLNRSERNNLRVIEGSSDSLFGLFLEIYGEMHKRKKFLETSDVRQFRLIQSDLPDSLKMKILIALSDGAPVAGVICSGIGDMGVYVFGGTSDRGLSAQGSYLLQWKALNWLKEQGATWYNLHGINPLTNLGSYHFKKGLCGKNGKDVRFLGTYDTYDNVTSRCIFEQVDSLRAIYKKGKVIVNGLRRSKAGSLFSYFF